MNAKEKGGLLMRIILIPIPMIIFCNPAMVLDLSILQKSILWSLGWILSCICGFLALKYQKPLLERDLEKIKLR